MTKATRTRVLCTNCNQAFHGLTPCGLPASAAAQPAPASKPDAKTGKGAGA